ncbi:hypothetical protein C8D87_11538 [Lentzea atacamensis]|uniref:Extracellular solute-binding protein n=1 Tax=Lentzea atacamensis TaxID=531938 RepID=A0ABX9DYK2_9PSEU|nr:hypothetical protein [Lentzea atacamensis]RAS59179.1 hypothetical protein C8D87_11538 [Lentzea atacamensis]
MHEPEFKAVDPRKRFLLWFVPPLAVFAAGLTVLLVSGHVTGPFRHITVVRAMLASKRDFFQDEQVKRILMARGYQVHVTPVGSRDLARTPDLDSYHFVFPSGHVANEHVKARRTGKHAVPFRPFFTPVVLGTFREYAEALVKAGVATPYDRGEQPFYYNLDVDQFMKLVVAHKRWSDYKLANGNRVIIQSPDPCKAYSGAVLVGFLASAVDDNPPQTVADAEARAREVKPHVDAQGQAGEDMAPKYFAPEGPTHAVIAVIYEHQYLAHQLNRRGADKERVLLYPTVQHQSTPELISFSPEGDRIGELMMTDPALRRRAVELGFHSLGWNGATEQDFAGHLTGQGLPEPPSGETGRVALPKAELFERMLDVVGDCR